ncbi:hypothetical protein [Luteolibacter luteus]|uniref:Lipoprotein n=1 Tax=Luteolibacter luteus TaxID=2728835 RepID=A0A858RI77_9BACT|nr:hypothetical protein [Luteolibacter luteus]QJE96208.1 hypothetical protein HHL09_10565 [Luteolibacter luteus]
MKKWHLVACQVVLAGGLGLFTGSCAHRTQRSIEETYGLKSTPDPAHFKHFYMPDAVDVRGLDTSAALEKVRTSYVGICEKAGEEPRDLAFEVPAGHEKPLRIKLSGGTLDSSVRHIAAASKLEVSLDGTTYRFKQPKETGRLVKRSFPVSPDFPYILGESGDAKLASEISRDPRIGFQRAGIDLDESTKLSLSDATTLSMETRSTADQVAVATLLSRTGHPVQQSLTTRVFEIAPGSTWKGPREGSFDAETASRMLADLSARSDVKASELPAATSRNGETITLLADGRVLRMKTSLVGTGHAVETSLSASSKRKHVELQDSGYTRNTGTRFTVKTRPDGSRVVFAVTPTLIDATGRPVYGQER